MAGTLIELDPAAATTGRAALPLTTSSDIYVDVPGIDWGTSEVDAFMAAEQQWGSSVISSRVPNRVVTAPVHITEQGRSDLQAKVGLLQREGGVILRQRPGGDPLYADIEKASLVVPDTYGEVIGLEPNGTLTLEVLPDLYGDLITLDEITATGEDASVLQQDGQPAIILGDYPGRATISILDTSGHAQYGALWAFRARHYASDAPALYPAASSLTPAAGASVEALTGAHDGDAITGTIGSGWTDLATLVAGHAGNYRAWARIYGTTGQEYRLAWNFGDAGHGLILPIDPTPLPAGGGFYILDLGRIRLDQMPGTQQWAGVIQGKGAGSGSIDMLYLQALDESAGKVVGDWGVNPAALANETLRAGWDGVARSISGGASFRPLVANGQLPRIPPSGLERRHVELFTKPTRGNLGTQGDPALDGYAVTVAYRPCWAMRPA